ncbi:MAG: TetR/AcrR family transcriptional regulator [Amycolatopsis sp.]|jgi:AcrR family transcriptional regulator|uniref:TetR/AcrR family transcriptional regulator n=1 Tax=Amycolatopsis sp. TaxID=37632 RepID=UPI002636F0BB|nr:TetR/AcrR family transcriptional regulator [Amycolatopsis sp.]MCU1687063.1 TetR/AcrR family transcriptional regulator [Amycolatopsis sp.]
MATRHRLAGAADLHSHERFLDAALAVLMDQGAAGLTVRAVAEAAGSSTITVYTRFGGRNGLLDSLYERLFDLLREAFDGLPPLTDDPMADLLDLAAVYRAFALESAARYAFMLERTIPEFDPDPAVRGNVIRDSFGVLLQRVERVCPPDRDVVQSAYLLWTTLHGLISVELTLRTRSRVPGWFLLPTEEANEPMYYAGVRAMITGLGLHA